MFGNEDHTNEVVLLTPITDNSGIMRALKVCFENIKIKGTGWNLFLTYMHDILLLLIIKINHLTVVEIRCNFSFFFSLAEKEIMMNFCAIYKVSVIYISCLVIREYLFFVLPAYHILAFQNCRKEVPYVFGLYI